MSGYREPGELPETAVVVAEPEPERISGGMLVRRAHRCRPPSFWSVLWHRIQRHDEWQCACGWRTKWDGLPLGWWPRP